MCSDPGFAIKSRGRGVIAGERLILRASGTASVPEVIQCFQEKIHSVFCDPFGKIFVACFLRHGNGLPGNDVTGIQPV